MSLSIPEILDIRDSFLELTSNISIRMAAYPKDEWLMNGGSLKGYLLVISQDAPPIAKSYPRSFLSGFSESDWPKQTHQDELKRAANIAGYWQEVEAHDYYKWLKKNDNFIKAWNKFQERKSYQLKTNPDAKLAINEFADFRFLRLVALHVGFQILADEAEYKPTYPDAKTIDRTKGYITKLRASFKDGVKIDNQSHQSQLDRLLEQLLLELNRAPRKEKVTPTMEKRKCLEAFNEDFLNCFKFTSATILSELAELLGWKDFDHTTIDRVIKKTKIKSAEKKPA